MQDLPNELLESLKSADEMLVKNDVNGALKHVHECIAKLKDYLSTTEPEWIEAKDLKGGFVNLKLPNIEPSDLSESQWWLVGRYLADGHYHSARSQFFISVGNNKISEFKEKCGEYIGAENEKAGCVQIGLKRILS